MAAATTMTNFAYALQVFYVPEMIMDTVGQDHPFLAMLLGKTKRVSSKFTAFPVQYSHGGGRSATFSSAQSGAASTQGVQLAIETVQDYAICSWTDEVLESTEGSDAATFFDAHKLEVDAKMSLLADSVSHALFRSGSGSIGRISAGQNASATDLQLAVPSDIIYLNVGQQIVADSTDGTGTVGTTVSFVKSLDRSAGTFEASATAGGAALTATAADLVANQYVFPIGDFALKLKGIAAWCPTTVAVGDSFFGINRYPDRDRLAGRYFDKSDMPIEEAISEAAKDVCLGTKAKPRLAILHPNDWHTLNMSMSTKVMIVDVKPNDSVSFSFKGILVQGPQGPIECISDSNCPEGEIQLLDMTTWRLMHKGPTPIHMIDRDGNTILRAASEDAYEGRIKCNLQLACGAPGFNARIKIS